MSPEAIDAMIAAGCTAEQIGAAVKAEMRRAENVEEARRAARRDGNRKRQQAWRDRNANNAHNAVTQRDTPPARTVSPCTPSKENNPPASSEANASSSAPARDDEQAAFDLFNETAHRNGLPVAEKLTKERRGKLKARLSEAGGLEGWGRAMARLEASDFCAGRRTDFRASIDFVLQPSSFTKLIEGTYDNNPNQRGRNERAHAVQQSKADQYRSAFDRIRDRNGVERSGGPSEEGEWPSGGFPSGRDAYGSRRDAGAHGDFRGPVLTLVAGQHR